MQLQCLLTEAGEVERLVRVAGLRYAGLGAIAVARVLSGAAFILWWHRQRPLPRLDFRAVFSSWPDSLVRSAQNGLDGEAWNGGRRALASAVLRVIHSRLITVQKRPKNVQVPTQRYVPLHIDLVVLRVALKLLGRLIKSWFSWGSKVLNAFLSTSTGSGLKAGGTCPHLHVGKPGAGQSRTQSAPGNFEFCKGWVSQGLMESAQYWVDN